VTAKVQIQKYFFKVFWLETMFLLSSQVVEHLLVPLLQPDDLSRLSACCVGLRHLLSSPAIWYRVYMRLWPQCVHPFAFSRNEDLSESPFDQDEDKSFLVDDGCDWRVATCLRYGLTHSGKRKSVLEQLALLKNDDELQFCRHAQDLIEDCMPKIQFEQSTRELGRLMANHQLDFGLVSLRYRNRSDGGISGMCNFSLECAVAVFFPQSAYPLIVDCRECAVSLPRSLQVSQLFLIIDSGAGTTTIRPLEARL